MAGERQTGAGFTQGDGIEEYLRDEYRAERGAYLEPRAGYSRPQRTEPARRLWGPRFAQDYDLNEDFAGAGTGLPIDRPVHPADRTPQREEWVGDRERGSYSPNYRGRGPKSYQRSD